MANQRGCLGRIFRLVFILAVLAGIGITAYWYLGPYKGYADDVFIEIDRGTSTRQIAGQLADDGVVRSRWAFLIVRALGFHSKLQAGEYRFASEQTPWQVFNKIRRGEVFYEDLTVPEGSTMFDIAALLDKADTVEGADFLKAAKNPASVRDLDPQAPNLEGYLFPSTYRLTHQTTAEQLCRLMTTEFRKQWAALNTAPHPSNIHRVVTLASLVEKETALPQERPMVAAVFENRLKLNMLLQCDPTTVYAALLEGRYRGTIHRSDLESENPYNTYTHAGLPPGAIANPGYASLKAALHPAPGDFLYFVARADGSGGHRFSSSLEEHNKAVQAYRTGER